MEEEAPNKRNELAVLTDHVFILILQRLTARFLCSYKCACHSWNSSSPNLSTVRSCPKLSPDSSIAAGKANATSPASTVNTPP
jgi:hypothetical protein